MKKTTEIIFFFLILFPGIFFPVSSDLAVFLRGGQTLLEGGHLYSDFIDLKPPLIFEIFAFVKLVTSGGETAVRIFDLIYQLVTSLLIVKISEKYLKSRIAAVAAGAFYAFSYVTLGFAQTAQTESFTGMWLILAVYLIMPEEKKFINLFLAGILTGLLFSLKFTVGIVLLGIFIFELTSPGKKNFVRNSLIILSGFAFAVFLSFIPLLHQEAFAGFLLVMQYLSFYSGMPPIDASFVKYAINRTGVFFGDNYSLLLTVSASIGAVFSFKGSLSNKKSRFLMFNILLTALLFISVAVEKKFGEYHFSRMLAPLAVLAGYGFSIIYRSIIKEFKRKQTAEKAVISVLIISALLFSPLPRWINLLKAPAAKIKSEEAYDLLFERDRAYDFMRVQHKKAAEKVNKNLNKGDKAMVISTGGNAVNYFLKTNNLSKFAQSQFYFGTYVTKKWEMAFRRELLESQWLIVQNNDRHLHINGHLRSSLESLRRDEFAGEYVEKNFRNFYKTENLIIFRRKN